MTKAELNGGEHTPQIYAPSSGVIGSKWNVAIDDWPLACLQFVYGWHSLPGGQFVAIAVAVAAYVNPMYVAYVCVLHGAHIYVTSAKDCIRLYVASYLCTFRAVSRNRIRSTHTHTLSAQSVHMHWTLNAMIHGSTCEVMWMNTIENALEIVI